MLKNIRYDQHRHSSITVSITWVLTLLLLCTHDIVGLLIRERAGGHAVSHASHRVPFWHGQLALWRTIYPPAPWDIFVSALFFDRNTEPRNCSDYWRWTTSFYITYSFRRIDLSHDPNLTWTTKLWWLTSLPSSDEANVGLQWMK